MALDNFYLRQRLNETGRKIAIDASMCLYQFLIAVRQENNMLTNSEGETTSHLVGFFYRTIRMIENGIKPVYVFDGKPPGMKSSELEKRQERREAAEKELEKAEEAAWSCSSDKRVMQLAYIYLWLQAPCEAEAQCAELVKGGKVYGTATEDMDGLTFGTNVLLRHMTYSEARQMPIKEFSLQKVLSGLELNRNEFIDLCILLGCDYCESIRGIGPKRAVELIKQHKSIEKILSCIDTKKYAVPEDWPYKEARQLFLEPEVTPADEVQLKWGDPDEEGLVKFLCEENGFSEERIRTGAKKLLKGRNTTTQGRLDTFFKVLPSDASAKRKRGENQVNRCGRKETAVQCRFVPYL
ncbi:hypothetical protein HPB48_002045 [Haemaphysalis longicornis]|uniref:Flap endonuclease 1 n=1 Tax=Haemaphysalis longicornis TaxID=44386 RepID=A0A9J6FGH8_HAELO|nr:hypothetical protein HPB48_002045 [Haemaphysalis longicornis]